MGAGLGDLFGQRTENFGIHAIIFPRLSPQTMNFHGSPACTEKTQRTIKISDKPVAIRKINGELIETCWNPDEDSRLEDAKIVTLVQFAILYLQLSICNRHNDLTWHKEASRPPVYSPWAKYKAYSPRVELRRKM